MVVEDIIIINNDEIIKEIIKQKSMRNIMELIEYE